MLIAQSAELPRDDLGRHPLTREGRRELHQGLIERRRVLADRTDQRRRRVRRELDAAQALALTEATEAAGLTGRGG